MDWLLAIALANTEAERDFSKLKIVKFRLRNRLQEQNLNALLNISINRPSVDEVLYAPCATLFCKTEHVVLRRHHHCRRKSLAENCAATENIVLKNCAATENNVLKTATVVAFINIVHTL